MSIKLPIAIQDSFNKNPDTKQQRPTTTDMKNENVI